MPTTNRLVNESSPYLRQHANNPVDWFPWGPEALARAKTEQKPIFLSIGYSACHWCHVMEHESFEDDETAQLLKEGFISIKVDREERPELDQIYMAAVVALTQRGGWPMSVFLTPDLKPFYAGTYFPLDDRYGMPSFKRVLHGVLNAWQERRDEILKNAENLTAHLRESTRLDGQVGELDATLLRQAGDYLRRAFDRQHGGFGQAPKFPHPMEIKLLLRIWQRFQDDDALEMARITLDRMARGGIYDHLGGGFHRYSTDAHWLVPHFEKMLYDNALLSQAYLEAYQATGNPSYHRVVDETLGWVLREMTSDEGGFYSTLDADSEGHEGKFYVWSAAEIRKVLGDEAFESFAYVYDVAEEGNWEGVNILHRSRPLQQEARLLGMTEEALIQALDAAKAKLISVRAERIRPGLDDKILTSWNGLMINAFAQAAQVLDARYLEPALRAAEFVWRTMRMPDGRLYRTCSPGHPPKLNAYLEDYAFLIDSFVTVYEASCDVTWIERARELARVMIDQFWDEKEGGFYVVGHDHEQLILRGKEAQDNAIPSGTSMAVNALLRLNRLTGQAELTEKAERTLKLVSGQLAHAPMAFGQMLASLDFYLGPVDELAIVGRADAPEAQSVLRYVRAVFHPNRVVAFLDLSQPVEKQQRHQERVPLLALKPETPATPGLKPEAPARAEWKPEAPARVSPSGAGSPSLALRASVPAEGVTTYVCRNFACQAPVVGLEALKGAWPEGHSPQTSPMTSSET